jgi:RNA polymerase sigma factor (sigma-70 family)
MTRAERSLASWREETTADTRVDWAGAVDRLVAGDPTAYRELCALVTRCLAGFRAHDLRDEWEDLVQEVLMATVVSARAGRIRSREATLSYIRRIAHNKHSDCLRRRIDDRREREVCWQAAAESPDAGLEKVAPCQDDVTEARRLLARLPDKKRRVLYAIHGAGQTYGRTSAELGIPRTTMKRYLRSALAELRAA